MCRDFDLFYAAQTLALAGPLELKWLKKHAQIAL